MNCTDHLMSRVATRMRFASMGVWFHRALLVLAAVLAVALLCSRLLGLLPVEWFGWGALAVVPAAALLVAGLGARGLAREQVARLVDERSGSKELFLSASMLGQNASEFAPIVSQQAEKIASSILPGRIVPFCWLPGFRNAVIALAVLAAGVQWLPQWDLLKMEQARASSAKQEKKLVESQKLTELRKVELQQKSGALTEQVEQAMMKLDKTLKDMKPVAKNENLKKLNEEAQAVSELWKKTSADLPKMAENLERAAQQFGDQGQAEEMKKMIEQLKKGDASALKQAMENTKKKMEEIAKMPEGAERKKQMEQLAKELAKMSNQMREQLGHKGANEALQRALEQLGMAKDKEAAQEAMQAAAESMNLSKEELEQLAEQFKDAKNLEDAMKNLAKAKQLNEGGKLDGADADEAKSMADYEKLYNELMAKNGQGDGQGQNGQGKAGEKPGIGSGGTVGEDPDALTKLKDEKAKTKMGAGKLLMQWKEEGKGETGQKADDYQAAVRSVKEGVAEAIRNERIPPGYHGAIQKYFDRLPEKTK